jgi:drug/metabolite transporter (DMT)-like permease
MSPFRQLLLASICASSSLAFTSRPTIGWTRTHIRRSSTPLQNSPSSIQNARPSLSLKNSPSNATYEELGGQPFFCQESNEGTNQDLHHNFNSQISQPPALSQDSQAQQQEGQVAQGQQEQAGFMGLSDVAKARLLLCAAAALYGTNFSVVKILGDTMPVGVSSTLRFGLAALAAFPWLVMNPKQGSLTAAWLGFEVGMWNSIGYIAQAIGLETTPASESAFICSLAVVTVPLLDFATGKKLFPRQWIGAIMAVVGVAVLELGGGVSLDNLSTGDLLSLLQPLAFGMGFWRMERAMSKYPDEASRSTAAQLLAVFCTSTIYALVTLDGGSVASYPWAEWLSSPSLLFSLFWTGCITTALTIYMETLALKSLSAAETTLIFSTEPLWGTAFAATVMGEQIGLNAGIGGLAILTGCLYSNLGWEGIQNFIQGNKVTTLEPSKTHKLPSVLQQQWIWFSSSIAATAATWSLALSDKAPLIEDLKDAAEDIIDKID